MNKLGIGTILAITGITLMIAGLIILPNAENSLAQPVHDIDVRKNVQIFDPSENLFVSATERVRVTSSNSGDVTSGFSIGDPAGVSCLDAGLLQQGEFLWSMKRAKLNFGTLCGFVDITVKATSTPETTETLSDCFSNNFFTKTVITSADATFSGTVGGTSVSGVGQIISHKSIFRSCP